MESLRIFIAGQKAFGCAVFDLARRLGHEIIGASAPLENSRGDGPDQLRGKCQTFNVPCLVAGSLTSRDIPPRTDLIVAAHSHDFIGRKTRYRAKYRAVGYHPSLLPRHRGRDSIEWAIRFGEPVTGGTIYWLDGVMDGGPIAAQDWCWIRPGDTAADLWRRELFPMGLRLFERVLSDVPHYYVSRQKQDPELATFEPAIDPPRKFRPDLLGLPAPD